jgi:leucyl-tRNA synthetase
VDVNLVDNDVLGIEKFKQWRPEYADAEFILESGKYVCGWAVEKMSKSMYNVVNPDDMVEKYGADTLRMYEMFLGPIELAKPWDTNGIDGVHRFLKKLWKLFFDAQGNLAVTGDLPTPAELKILHKTIKKIKDDIEHFSFNTSVSAFMICVNELTEHKCNQRDVLQPLVVLLSPFAPHIAEELWHVLGNAQTVCDAAFPQCDETYLVETAFEYPVSFNGKVRYKKTFPLGIAQDEVQKQILADANTAKALDGKEVKKIIFVEGKIVNVVC